MRRIVITIIGVALFIGTIAGENLKQLSDWSNAQAIGFNIWTLFCLIGVPYIIFLQFKKKLKNEIPMTATNIAITKEKEIIKVDRNKTITGIIILVLIGGAFYWFSIRPENIRKECFIEAKNEAENMLKSESRLEMTGFPFTRGDYEKTKTRSYDECILKNGLSK